MVLYVHLHIICTLIKVTNWLSIYFIFVEVKLEDLNEKVQEAVRTISETYELNSLQYNAEKQITKIEATKKDDQSKKTFYLDKDGVETTMDQSSEPLQNTSEGME